MSPDNKQDQNKREDPLDIFTSIPSPESVDPFDGLDLGDICATPKKKQPTVEVAEDNSSSADSLFSFDPLEGIDLQEITANTELQQDHPAVPHESAPPPKASTPTVSTESLPASKNNHSSAAQVTPTSIHPLLEQASRYSELTRIREKIVLDCNASAGNILMITSPKDNAGKTLLAAALAYNMVRLCNNSVLLIDCNMRHPDIHTYFNLPQQDGFTEMIIHNQPCQAMIKETSLSGLHVLTAGRTSNTLYQSMQHHHLPDLLSELRRRYDFVIIDTSPVLAQNRNNVDTVVLSKLADYGLFVIRNRNITQKSIKEAVDMISAGNGKINGIVYNQLVSEKKPASPFYKK